MNTIQILRGCSLGLLSTLALVRCGQAALVVALVLLVPPGARGATLLPVTPAMLSGPLAFIYSPVISGFSSPIPYGIANNLTDVGWIWANESHLVLNGGGPIALTKLRAYTTYADTPRGAVWAIEVSDDGVSFEPVGEFVFETKPGGGVNDDGTARSDCAGWYEVAFNQEGAKLGQYWRVRQTRVTVRHAPRTGQLEFYTSVALPTVKSFSPTGDTVPGNAVITVGLQDSLTAVAPGSISLDIDGARVAPTIDPLGHPGTCLPV